jgi:hypothetical protein
MIVLVTGGRDFNDLAMAFDAIAAVHETTPISVLVHGDAKGADTLAGNVAKELGINVVKCPANWIKYKKAAGPIRNAFMLDMFNIDLVIEFPGGAGTADMVAQSRKRDIPVIPALDIISDAGGGESQK